ncbi:7-carboxy-7-deazaguanine synthase QueE [Luteibaculum oceani]|uniref:7-carboxy-7-deazaguanine synthase n=1 Tax=Luteibaculum oceani TaxID=1294296 RepID=A0A5C6VC55_9FLAO|nr:7-carboxy-7-deazaguanine synthase QueE [Luteibaculum oceani]TXC82176.1 4Fe-4S cluster-binding domain-containing protein [Luteibaculum oceani]
MERFLTLQGEGRYSGYNAYFIRLAGCDVGCVWCDVKESWEVSENQWVSYNTISNWLKEESTGEIVVVTGGEPLMYDLKTLTKTLRERNKRCHIETSGAYKISGDWDWITFSPKKFKAPLPEIYEHCDELKVVVYNKSDLNWAVEHQKKLANPNSVHLLLQPEWSKRDKVTPLIIDFIHKNPEWSLSLQTHKYIGIE